MLRFYLSFQQAKHFLQHVFGWPYDVNYYAGDWLMGPNYFCWQPICYMPYGINAFAWHVKPHTYSDVQHVIDKIMKHKETIERYRFVSFQVAHNIFLLSFFLATIVFLAYVLIVQQTSALQYDKSTKADFVRPKDVFRDLTKLRRQQEHPKRNRIRKRNNNIALVLRFFC